MTKAPAKVGAFVLIILRRGHPFRYSGIFVFHVFNGLFLPFATKSIGLTLPFSFAVASLCESEAHINSLGDSHQVKRK